VAAAESGVGARDSQAGAGGAAGIALGLEGPKAGGRVVDGVGVVLMGG